MPKTRKFYFPENGSQKVRGNPFSLRDGQRENDMRLARSAQDPWVLRWSTAPTSGKVLQKVLRTRSEAGVRKVKLAGVVRRVRTQPNEALNNEIVARGINLMDLGAGFAILKCSFGSSRRLLS